MTDLTALEFASEKEMQIYHEEYRESYHDADCIFGEFTLWASANGHNVLKEPIKPLLKEYFQQDIYIVNRAKNDFFYGLGVKGRLNRTAFSKRIEQFINFIEKKEK